MKYCAKGQIFLTLWFIFALSEVFAQDLGDIELGPKLGLSFTRVVSPGDDNAKDRVTFNAGVTGEYYFSNRWGIKLNLISDNKGFANGIIIDENMNPVVTVIELNYLTIPVMANWHFSKHRRWNLSFGSYLGLLISAKDSELQADIKNQINTFDFGLAFGIGYKFEINEYIKLFLALDEQLGIKNIISGDNDYSIWNTRGSYDIGVLINL